MTQPNSAEPRLPLANWGHRFIALLIDAVILLIIFVVIYWKVVPIVENIISNDRPSITVADGINSFIAALFRVLFFLTASIVVVWGGLFEGIWGRTPGKVAAGLKVVSANDHNQTIGIARGLAREITRYIPFLVGFLAAQETIVPAFLLFLVCWPINHLWPLWDNQNLTLHDKLVGSRVVCHVISQEYLGLLLRRLRLR